MKKKVLFVASLFLATATFAQDGLTSKKGEAFLPEAGDWALGFDGTPFLNYAGNWFSGSTSQNSVSANSVGNQPMTMNGSGPNFIGNGFMIVGKYFKDETTAFRGKVRIGFGSTNTIAINDTSGANNTLTGEVTDEMSTSYFNLTLGGGIEKRRGNTRIQGFYGGELLFSLGSASESYTYGDVGNGTNTTFVHNPSYYDFDNGVFVPGNLNGASTGERVTERVYGSTMVLSLRGFIGVEWFLAPKVSVSAEYGWGLAMSSTGDGEEDTEEYTPALPSATPTEQNILRKHNTGGSSAFGIDTDNNGGVITIYFHF